MRKVILIIVLFSVNISMFSQEFSRKDSLRGELTPLRTCYYVTFYNLDVTIDEKERFIERSFNEIHFIATADFETFQIDLAENMEILIIEFEQTDLDFEREFDAVFVKFPRVIKKGENQMIRVWYDGYPREAVNAPWDGGFSWKKDKNDNPWIGVSCQGLGASVWWPNKDHQSDEPDSMRITVSARKPLKIICNGNLRSETIIWNSHLQDSLNRTEWFVSYPINNYNITLNIGDYIHFQDEYVSGEDTLDLSYYVLSYNEEKAKKHFEQVKPMMSCFEKYFGKYPFWEDGYALVETPYLGMEHQSAIAYGNDYLPGYHGSLGYSGGLEFDYIIIHETGHEWWGNSITTNDIADMWIHEGFCTYSEALYVECMYGYNQMLEYVNNQKRFIRNKSPIVGCYHVNHQGSGDMYQKASVMLHTLRTLIEDDELWFSIIRDISDKFKYKTINASDIMTFIMQRTEKDLTVFFSQYLNNSDLPEFQYQLIKEGRNTTIKYRWEAIEGFDMPLLINSNNKDFWIYPNNNWKEMSLGKIDSRDFSVKEELFLLDIKKVK
ncbi:MAG: M1 family metallopeptidase [Flavobacteriales bacterium]|jgi:aminopeptidase N|nr:M1 family metallopeptidase [Flavobacteriales bacterium]MBT7481368.1 M1 family metallopeptidase [Flavobacteriales bacterium]